MWNLKLMKIFVMHISNTCACNTYTDFCDGISENKFIKNNVENFNVTKVHKNLDKSLQMDYVNDLLDRSVRSFKPYRSEKALSLQITTILDELLFDSGYDRQIRPQIDGPPLEVS